MRITRRDGVIAAASVAIVGGSLILGGCAKFVEPFQDAPTAGHQGSSMRVLENGDGFSNVGQKCDGLGHMVFVVYHGDHAYGSVYVVNDARCGSLTSPLPFDNGQTVTTSHP
jgi:hypothetical protein